MVTVARPPPLAILRVPLAEMFALSLSVTVALPNWLQPKDGAGAEVQGGVGVHG